MSRRLPDFVIVGAMKCGTSTLHEQLARQPGFFMSEPKEPCFFSDDQVWERGFDWYADHFARAAPGDLCGESSTHYTKLPTYRHTVGRLKQHLPDAKFIYVMRHPIERLRSQFIHEWTERKVSPSIEEAILHFPPLVEYSRYAMQLRPFFEAFGSARLLPVFFERMIAEPQAELERVCRFLGYSGKPTWDPSLGEQNISAQRLRTSPVRDAIAYAPVISQVRSHLVPRAVRDRIKRLWTMQARPTIPDDQLAWLTEVFDRDLAELGRWLGTDLTCDTWKAVARRGPLQWTDAASDFRRQSASRVGVVVIGRNEGERLDRCLDSVVGKASPIVYVDSGSTDGSVAGARTRGIEVIELDMSRPFTAARARNEGWRRLLQMTPDLAYVQFVDGDCEVVDGWLGTGRLALDRDDRLAVVCGRRRERRREDSPYNRLCDMEWDTPVGLTQACGGDALIRVSALREVDGFDASLICGEEPDLCTRLRRRGWLIERIDRDMTLHDAAITRFGQWWKRTVRGGWYVAQSAAMHGKPPERRGVHESRNIWFYGVGLPVVALMLAPLTLGLSVVVALAFYARHVTKVYRDRIDHGNSHQDARLYALLCTIGKSAEGWGQLRYWMNRATGRHARLIEYKGDSVVAPRESAA
jgi:GT2 family glycosyltransferase